MALARHITLPAGFVAGAVHCGLKTTNREDLAILAAVGGPVPAAVVTTTNQVVGAPVRWCRQVLPGGHGKVRAVVVNAGNANTCNGKRGDRDAAAMAARTAGRLGCKPEEVLVCSTGVIGHPLPMDVVNAGIDAVAPTLSWRHDAAVARAIMTTDTKPKSAVVQGRVAGKLVTVAGVAKGAGMIAPSLATMLGYLTTNANLSPAAAGKALREAAGSTFNAITVDGDRSTSDTVVLLASGAVGGSAVTGGDDLAKFTRLLRRACLTLAEAMVRDGEGATKLVRVTVQGARTDAEAAACARTVANSLLLKCAIHGGDPNWGRILAAAGRSDAKVDQDRATCKLGGHAVMRRGTSCDYDRAAVEAHMASETVEIDLNLSLGDGRYTAITCDLSRRYIAINADYHT